MATRIKVALPSSFPYQDSWMLLAERAARRPPDQRGSVPPAEPSLSDPQTQIKSAAGATPRLVRRAQFGDHRFAAMNDPG
jgi:hypothetical protein